MVEHPCVVCGGVFAAPTRRVLTCSGDCRETFRSWPRWTVKNCEMCDGKFQNDKHHPKRFCGIACRDADRASARHKTCPVCGKDYKAARAEQVHCSKVCSGKANSGRGSRGGPVPLCACGQPIPNKARRFCSDECRERHQKRRQKSRPDETHVCQRCGEPFVRPWYYAGIKQFCSPRCQRSSIPHTSQGEQEISRLVHEMGIRSEKFILPSTKEIDVFCPDQMVGFEFNGSFFHSLAGLERRGSTEGIRYHLNKTNECAAEGIFLYHVWEYEWRDPRQRPIVESQIRTILGLARDRIYARKCVVVPVDSPVAQMFLDTNHLIGRVAATHHYGLLHKDDLVAIMSFDHNHELVRYCVRQNTSVIGGAGKLFSHYVREHSPPQVVSYSDQAKTTGKMYERLGFTLSHVTDPEYVNYHPGTGEIRRRYQTMRRVLLRDFPELDASMTERQMCDALGFTRIYGCGKKVWRWSPITPHPHPE